MKYEIIRQLKIGLHVDVVLVEKEEVVAQV